MVAQAGEATSSLGYGGKASPSSAAAERVFLILKASFNEQQDCALVNYIQASVMAQYNKR